MPALLPGGKTAHLLEHATAAGLQVTALEIDPERARRIGETLSRLDLQAQVLVADAGQPEAWFESQCGGQQFDAILLDAPCTASGIVRRQPDVRWLRRESDVAQLAPDSISAARQAVAFAQTRRTHGLLHLLRLQGRGRYAGQSVSCAQQNGHQLARLPGI